MIVREDVRDGLRRGRACLTLGEAEAEGQQTPQLVVLDGVGLSGGDESADRALEQPFARLGEVKGLGAALRSVPKGVERAGDEGDAVLGEGVGVAHVVRLRNLADRCHVATRHDHC